MTTFRLLCFLAASVVLLVLYRFAEVGIHRVGDVVSLGVLAVTAGLEAAIVGGGVLRYYRDPAIERVAQMRAELELAKHEKARRRRGY